MTELLMDDTEFKAVMDRLRLMCTIVADDDSDIDGFLQRAERAQTLGPFLDPTLWMRGTNNLRAFQEIARAYQTFRAEVQRRGNRVEWEGPR